MVYQLDAGFRRLLWCGPERRVKTLLRFFRMFGKERSAKLWFICSDMWSPYLKVIAKKAPQALNVLDRFHIMKKFGEAIDQIRRAEIARFREAGTDNLLQNGRWALLKRPENLSEKQAVRLSEPTFFERTSSGSGPSPTPPLPPGFCIPGARARCAHVWNR